jgi:hypothetical protein
MTFHFPISGLCEFFHESFYSPKRVYNIKNTEKVQKMLNMNANVKSKHVEKSKAVNNMQGFASNYCSRIRNRGRVALDDFM